MIRRQLLGTTEQSESAVSRIKEREAGRANESKSRSEAASGASIRRGGCEGESGGEWNEVVDAPGPRQWPLIGSALWLAKFGDFETLIAEHARSFGPISVARCRNHEIYFVADPELVREVTVYKAATFRDREYPLTWDDVASGCRNGRGQGAGGGGGVVTARGAEHTIYRDYVAKAFFSPRSLVS